MKKCTACNLNFDDDKKFCVKCGETLTFLANVASTKHTKKCNACNLTYENDKKFCKSCGKPLSMIVLSATDTKKMVFEEKLKINNLDVTVLSEYAQFLYDNKEYNNTVAILVKIMAIDGNNSFAHNLLFNTYQKQNAYKDAIEIGTEILLKEPKNKALLENLAQLANALDDKEQEVRFYKAMVELSPNDNSLLTKQANLLLHLDKITEATQLFSQLFSLGDRQRITLIYTGIDQVTIGNYKTANETFSSSLSSSEPFPNDSIKQSFYLYYAYSQSQTGGSFEQIDDTFNKVVFEKLNKTEANAEMASKILLHLLELILTGVQKVNPVNVNDRIGDLTRRYFHKIVDLANTYKTVTNPILGLYLFKMAEVECGVGLFAEALDSIIEAKACAPMNTVYSDKYEEINKLVQKEERKRKIKKAIIISAAVLGIIIAGITIMRHLKNKEIEIWKKAITTNTVEAYKQYLKVYPEGVYKVTADSLCDHALWTETLSSNTYEACQNYKIQFPTGRYISKVDSLCEEKVWQNSIKLNSVESYKEYINKYPNGKYLNKAQKKYNLLDIRIGDLWKSEIGKELGGCGNYYYSSDNSSVLIFGGTSSSDLYIVINEQLRAVYPEDNNNENVEVYSNREGDKVRLDIKKIKVEYESRSIEGIMTITTAIGQRKVLQFKGSSGC